MQTNNIPNRGLPNSQSKQKSRQRLNCALISLAVALLLLVAKFAAYLITGSVAVLSDALESIVNLVAAAILIWSIKIASTPADKNHPYGHGKVEGVSSSVEGAMIIMAAIIIVIESVGQIIEGPSIYRLEIGLIIVLGASVVNAVLGYYLIRQGKRLDSLALVADGKHVLSDVWTSVGILVGLTIVHFTGWAIVDPIIGILVSLLLFYTGWSVTKNAVNQLMNTADEGQLQSITESLAKHSKPSWINFHNLRSWKSGYSFYVDAHLVVPSYYDVKQLHQIREDVANLLIPQGNGEVILHFDPCRPIMCKYCKVKKCPIRKEPFKRSLEVSVDTITSNISEHF